ncbi:MAG: transglycosylase domain-containing protein [Succinivibrionaceae bacterium]|nr:transglycosylase domain-containing protein [Succinivibrionaceae bacterium]MBR1636133.1 transglycosylase domain-containing protein [Lachnospiraceae bacterium]
MAKTWYLLPAAAAALLGAAVAFCNSCIEELDFSPLEQRSRVLYARDGSVAAYTLSSDTESYRFYTRIDDVSPLYLRMLLAGEDRNFFSHPGADFPSLLRAALVNLKNGRVISGGSTIAMQVAKRLTGHERTYYNKLKEIVQAVYLTRKYGRTKVLEWYLTLAPFGGNIEGVNAASLKWFGHPPRHLSPSEAALLTALPRAPEAIRPDRNRKSTLHYKNEALRLAYEKGVISAEVWQASLKDDPPHELHTIAQSARSCLGAYFSLPEFGNRSGSRPGNRGESLPDDPDSNRGKAGNAPSSAGIEDGRNAAGETAASSENLTSGSAHDSKKSGSSGSISNSNSESGSDLDRASSVSDKTSRTRPKVMDIQSALDPYIQRALQSEGEIFHAKHNDGAVLSAVALDSRTHQVVGILGSSDLRVSEMCLPFAQRSPGSALKPFAYGLAFQERRLHPATILHDDLRLFGSWSPLNFTRRFSGRVSAASALTRSLNLPALEVLELVGARRFYNFLNRFGQIVTARDDVTDYSLILGSVNISLYDLARLYAMLNEDGMLRDFSFASDGRRPDPDAGPGRTPAPPGKDSPEASGADTDTALQEYLEKCDRIFEGDACRFDVDSLTVRYDAQDRKEKKVADNKSSWAGGGAGTGAGLNAGAGIGARADAGANSKAGAGANADAGAGMNTSVVTGSGASAVAGTGKGAVAGDKAADGEPAASGPDGGMEIALGNRRDTEENSPAAGVSGRKDIPGETDRDPAARQAQLLKFSDRKDGYEFFQADAARTIFDILKSARRPAEAGNMAEVSYKTGTSSHYIDAIAAGSLGSYTVAVAVRIPDNRLGFYQYSGLRDAAPPLFRIMNQLKLRDFPKPEIASDLMTASAPDLLAENMSSEKRIDASALHIVFPAGDSTVMPDFEGRIFVKHTGGRGRLLMTVEGRQFEGDYFVPERQGRYRVSLMDLEGNSDSVEFTVVMDEPGGMRAAD